MTQKNRVLLQMHASIKTVAFGGIDSIPVEVQINVAKGLTAMLSPSRVNGSVLRWP